MIKTKDYFLTQEDFTLKPNSRFGYLETTPIPKNLAPYYESKNYISHTDRNKTLFEKVYQLIKRYNLNYKYKIVKPYLKNEILLDYGCGTGDFLNYLKSKNHTIFGVEPNEKALITTQNKIGKNQTSSQELKKINKTFSVITLWHVLEHIPNIESFIPELKNHLEDNGRIFIAVPNYKSLDAKFYKKHWAGYDVPRHLWHFSPKSMSLFLDHFGMKIEKTYPLWFDSFYVSILSEKYKKNRLGIMTAIVIGFLSNFTGAFNKNYSSVIYQIRKNENKAF